MKTDYALLTAQMNSLIEGESDFVAVLANVTALLNQTLDDINWVGFYLLDEQELVLGPFQGNVACYRIAIGRGVCGVAIAQSCSQLVDDVHEFDGHIACDSASVSELVVPLRVNGETIGVLDIDSPSLSRFDQSDKLGIESLVEALGTHLENNSAAIACRYAKLGK